MTERLEKSLFFGICGGGLGALAGGVIGLAKGIPLPSVLPSASFRTAAFFGTISGVKEALEYVRGVNDSWNPLLAGGWTGFIFGRALGRSNGRAVAGAINGAVLTWLMASVSVSKAKGALGEIGSILNPFPTQQQEELLARIALLQSEISSLKHQNDEK